MTGDQDLAYGVVGDEKTVSAWSSKRLSFEPKGRLLAYREELRAVLRRLNSVEGAGLVAIYQSPDDTFVDVENVALYNVGAGHYGHLTATGLTCRREPSPDDRHHLVYRVGPLEDPDPRAGRVLARMTAPTSGVMTAGTVWAFLRPVVQLGPGLSRSEAGPFCVDVTVGGNWSGRGIANLVKSTLDGLIGALHQHDGSHHEAMLSRLAVLGDPQALWDQLVDPAVAVLGRRTLVRPHMAGMAWNPADERCTSFRVRREPSAQASLSAVVRAR